LAITFGSVLGPIQSPAQWVPGALSPGVEWPHYEADHSPPSSAVKNAWSCTSTPTYYFFLVLCSVKDRMPS